MNHVQEGMHNRFWGTLERFAKETHPSESCGRCLFVYGIKAPLPRRFDMRTIQILVIGCGAVMADHDLGEAALDKRYDYHTRYAPDVADILSRRGGTHGHQAWCAVLDVYFALLSGLEPVRCGEAATAALALGDSRWWAPGKRLSDPRLICAPGLLRFAVGVVAAKQMREPISAANRAHIDEAINDISCTFEHTIRTLSKHDSNCPAAQMWRLCRLIRHMAPQI